METRLLYEPLDRVEADAVAGRLREDVSAVQALRSVLPAVLAIGTGTKQAVRRIRTLRRRDTLWEEVRQVVTLWQSGEAFERAGGKRERGVPGIRAFQQVKHVVQPVRGAA